MNISMQEQISHVKEKFSILYDIKYSWRSLLVFSILLYFTLFFERDHIDYSEAVINIYTHAHIRMVTERLHFLP